MTGGLSAPPRAAGGAVPARGDINPLTRRIYNFGETIKAAGCFVLGPALLLRRSCPPQKTPDTGQRSAEVEAAPGWNRSEPIPPRLRTNLVSIDPFSSN